MIRQEGLEGDVLQTVASLEFVAPYRLEDAKELIRSALVSAPRLYFSLIRHRSDWPISGRVTNNGFQIRTRSAWSNGSNLVWALGKFEPEDGKTKVRVRFVPEPIGTAGLVLTLVVVVDVFEHACQRCGFAAAGGPRNKNNSALAHRDFFKHFRKMKSGTNLSRAMRVATAPWYSAASLIP